ncbi:AAA family ATPase [Chryseobacterium sp. X308]|uniref:AbiJ-related protein n=1 Tax=Chryseobacterium sp. X308 TaxID=2884873 RepID=UPI001D13E042|nr:AAA family ATPase [Chryseobacterium sp. X308]MCC3214815.1 AAA family ATPase [Chryseobacterium sp. X308]
MSRISEKVKKELLKVLLQQKDLFGEKDELFIVNLLDLLLDLRSLPSQDNRFENAYEDTNQHFIINNDWEIDYLLQERFKIIENDEIFTNFLNYIISPEIRESEDNIIKYYLLITPYLENEGLAYVISNYSDSNLPIYELGVKKNNNGLPYDLITNKINFYVFHRPEGKKGYPHYDFYPSEYPSFGLYHNSGWNDFSNFSEYELFYFTTQEDSMSIGNVKIIKTDSNNTPDNIENNFSSLSEEYCSLGQSIEYYENFKSIFGNDFLSKLWALKDAAFFTDIQENFENDYYFKNSLIRYDEQEQILRSIKYRIYDYDLKNLYSFKYHFQPKYSERGIGIDFNFDSESEVPNRIYALIGKNGTGKTQLVSTLPLDISRKRNQSFIPKTPLFSKVIAVSYSIFDKFEIPQKNSSFNYVYCGLRETDGELYSEKGLKLRFHNSWKKIKSNRRFEKWMNLLPLFMDTDLVNEFIVEDEDDPLSHTVDIKAFNGVSGKLSSGQSILLYILTEIVANIRYDSLIIYDEPETHLHPNAISQLMNTVYELTNEFRSYCIIATHSPLIVREILSKNVYVLEKESNILVARRPLIETFGENLTIITEEIFGNRDVPKQFKIILERLVKKGYSFNEIIDLLQSGNIPLSLNAMILLKSILNEES